MDLSHIFSRLPNLSKLELTYGKINKNEYERSPVRMKISDAGSLKQCIKTTDVLTTLCYQPPIDDDLRQLMGVDQQQHDHSPDFSTIKLQIMAKAACKALGSRSVLLA